MKHHGSPLPRFLTSLSESGIGGEGLGVRGIYSVRRCWITATIRSRTPVGSGDMSCAGMRTTSNRLSRNQLCIAHRILISKLSSGATTIARHQLNRVFKFIRSAALITSKLGGLVIASSCRHADSPSPPAPLPQTSLYSSQRFRLPKSVGVHDQSESIKRLVRGRGEPFWGNSLLDLAVLGASPPVFR
ncbi:hypothetical protein TBK1r_74770 [Stieleria magnilauensis]|uniref:Uncharacterized protein n=1 Tax=Stieleria magnilauensis TaxID=2527963 RepID=A0ABX5Y2G1_9BACT|nr:hypothetical protein TBK1r_74770 [Planctomycetes bacterium TBK1r]